MSVLFDKTKWCKVFVFHFFLVSQKDETFLRNHKEVRKSKIMWFFISILGCLRQEGLINFYPKDFHKYLKNGSKHETFTNVPFRHNSVCVIQKCATVITVRLVYISWIYPNGSKIIQLLLFMSFILLLKTELWPLERRFF